MTNEPRTEWIDLAEVAAELQVSRATLVRMAIEDRFPPILIVGARRKLVRRDLYAQWIERHTISAESERQRRQGERASYRRVQPEHGGQRHADAS